jgi:hypothetical protein
MQLKEKVNWRDKKLVKYLHMYMTLPLLSNSKSKIIKLIKHFQMIKKFNK